MLENPINMDTKSINKKIVKKSNMFIPKISIDLGIIKNNTIQPTGITPKSPIALKIK